MQATPKYHTFILPELLELHLDTQLMLRELSWKLAKAERRLIQYKEAKASAESRLQKERLRLAENLMALDSLSPSNRFYQMMMLDNMRTKIRIEKLQRKIQGFQPSTLILLELKKALIQAKIDLYQERMKEIQKHMDEKTMPKPPKKIIPKEPKSVERILVPEYHSSDWMPLSVFSKKSSFHFSDQ